MVFRSKRANWNCCHFPGFKCCHRTLSKELIHKRAFEHLSYILQKYFECSTQGSVLKKNNQINQIKWQISTWYTKVLFMSPFLYHCQLRARRVLLLFRDVPWEPEGRYRCKKSLAIVPFWFSMEHGWRKWCWIEHFYIVWQWVHHMLRARCLLLRPTVPWTLFHHTVLTEENVGKHSIVYFVEILWDKVRLWSLKEVKGTSPIERVLWTL